MSLPDEARLPFRHPPATASLRRLSRASLISLALTWLEPSDLRRCGPVLDTNALVSSKPGMSSGSLASLEQIRSRFLAADELKDSKKEVLEAIDVHWSAGLTLRQWVMVDEMRIASEIDGSAGQSGMHWAAFKMEPVNVDHGAFEKYVWTVDGGDATRTAHSLRTKAAVLARDLQAELAPLVRTHIAILKPGQTDHRSRLEKETHMEILRVVCFRDGALLSKEGLLSDCDNVKVLFITFRDVGNTLYTFPANVSLEGDGHLSLVLQALSRKLSLGMEGRAELKQVTAAIQPLTCRDLFNNGPTDITDPELLGTAPDNGVVKTTSLKAPKMRTKPDKAGTEKRMRIKELRNKVRFQGEDDSDEDNEEDVE